MGAWMNIDGFGDPFGSTRRDGVRSLSGEKLGKVGIVLVSMYTVLALMRM